jgi:Tol biopolymer transport system component
MTTLNFEPVLQSLLGDQELPAGARFAKYEIVSRLGRGGMGDVYLARDVVLERKVALKLLSKGLGSVQENTQLVFSEARAASSLNHQNIVIVYDAGESDGRQFLATEYVRGETLRETLRGQTLSLRDALDIAAQIASALSAAHAAGVVHRDIKPENIMLRPDGVVKVLDFGIAKVREIRSDGTTNHTLARAGVPGTTTRGAIIGSVPYMSPEQAAGKDVDQRSDIFSFGSLLYEMVTGVPAFKGTSDVATLQAVALHHPTIPASLDLPTPLIAAIARCLQKDREARPKNMGEISTSLDQLRARLARRSLPVWLIAVAAISGLLAVAAVVFWLRASSRGNVQETFVAQRLTHNGVFKEPAVAFDGRNVFYDEVEDWKRSTLRLSVNSDNAAAIQIPRRTPDENFEVQDGVPGLNGLLMRDWRRGGYTAGTFSILRFPEGTRTDIDHALGYSGAWSRDGSRIAYLSEETSSGEVRVALFVATLDGKVTRVCSLNEPPKRPTNALSWSPQGRIWFLEKERLLEVDAAAGATPHPVFRSANAPQGSGRWTLDGQRFVFSEMWTQDLYILRTGDPPESFVTRVTSGPLQFGTPAPARDGKTIYAVGQLRRGQAVRYDSAKRRWVPLLEGLSADGVDYSIGGKKLVYTSYPEAEMWASNADGSGREQLTHAPMRAFLPRWSPDGKKITFMGRVPGEPWRAYLIPAPHAPMQRLINGAGSEATPSWSPDGSNIIYSPFGWDVPAEQRRILIYDLATRKSRELPGSAGLFSPRWSPDGRYIAALRFDRYGMNPAVLYDYQTQKVQDIGVSGVYLSWSRDSRKLYLLNKTPLNPARVVRVTIGAATASGVQEVPRAETVVRFQERIVANSPLPSQESIWLGFTPQEDPILLQDLGNREIYRLRSPEFRY